VALEINIVDAKGVKIVSCSGRLVMGPEIGSFQTKVGGLLPGSPNLVLELKALDQLDSTGLGAIVELRKKARDVGGDVRLAAVANNSKVYKVLLATRFLPADPAAHPLEHHFLLFDDERQAVSSFTGNNNTAIGNSLRKAT
jgi:anti-anti-sigma factor